MKLTLEIIRSFKLPERTFKPDWDDTAIAFTLPNGIELTGFTQLNREPIETDSLESEDGQIYIETKEELEQAIFVGGPIIVIEGEGNIELYYCPLCTAETYYDRVLGQYRCNECEWSFSSSYPPNKKANEIIDALSDRGGFDGWWDYLDDDTKTEILNEIQSIIDN
jgi:hypothetical protein